jgi:hypothetical protein
MKQNITTDQLAQLSDKQRYNLVSWCFKNDYFTRIPVPGEAARFTDLKKGISLVIDEPLLSIGQMIEFLEERGSDTLIDDMLINDRVGGGCTIEVTDPQGNKEWDSGFVIDWDRRVELCDALWEAVKEAL